MECWGIVNGVDYYKLQGSKLVKLRSESYPTYSVKPISYTTFNGKPYFVNMNQDLQTIHAEGYADANVQMDAEYKEMDDCYEVPVSVTYYYQPLHWSNEEDSYWGYQEYSNIRFAKDAKIICIDGTGNQKTVSIGEFLK